MEKIPLLELKPVDREYFQTCLDAFLPARIIDVHTHVWLSRFRRRSPGENVARVVSWPDRVAAENPIEDLLDTYRLMLPGRQITPVIFGMTLTPGDDLEGGNAYISESAARHNLPGLIFADPRWSADEFESRISVGGFLGAKVYLTWANTALSGDQIEIFDFLPRQQLEVLNRRGWIVILHVPRSGRLKDPVNLEQLCEIDHCYPDASVIVAHVGRAYCREDIGDAFSVLSQTRNLFFDISANTNDEVFAKLIAAVGPKRILFGSDLPITRMRMRRVCENGTYVNLVPRFLYGDVSGDKNMREVDGEEAARLSFFLYEELDAFRRASERSGLARADIEDVFYNNAFRLLEKAGMDF
ncbi:MAG TPA: amidohydrolase family protein [Acidobacteriota bacterium]|nr:amidohydrolase family protein [Acidobacteriota bacterium]